MCVRLTELGERHAQGSTMHGKALDIAHRRVRAHLPERLQSGETEVEDVLVVDRVELEPIDEIDQVRDLDGNQASSAGEERQRIDEPVSIGNVGEHVVRDHEVGVAVALRRVHVRRQRREMMSTVSMPLRRATAATFSAGSIPSDRMPSCGEVLEEVAVVARGFDHVASVVEAERAQSSVLQMHVRARGTSSSRS